ncbi:MAG: FlgD immunoglobulin-like domain containing protein [Candidatus Eisenbacteria bacterium]
MYEQVGTSASAYLNYTNARLAVPTPVTIESKGVINEDGGWVTATFKAVDTVARESLTARFAVIEETSLEYPWTAREVASPATVTLSVAGDSMVVTRNFNVTWAVQGELDVLVWIEDPSPLEVLNAQIMPFAYNPGLASPDFALEAGYGETTVHTATLSNDGAVPDTITVTMTQDVTPAGVTSTDWVADYREAGGSWTTGPSVFVLLPDEEVDLEVRLVDTIGTTPGLGVTSLHATSGGTGNPTADAAFATFVDQPSLLVIDDDGGASLETHIETALSDNSLMAQSFDADALGRPSLGQLNSYWAVLWTTAGSDCSQFTNSDESNMKAYLDQGGNLFLASNDFLSSHLIASSFISDYLHVDTWSSDVGGFAMVGVAGDPVSDGMSLGQAGGPLPTAGNDSFVLTGGDEIFASLSTTRGMKVEENGHKLVFIAFPFENVKTTIADPSNQKSLIDRILSWFELATGVEESDSVVARRLALEQNAPNPFNPKTAISFTVPGGAADAKLEVYSVAGKLVATLYEGPLSPERHTVVWDGKDAEGQNMASGIYFARLAADGAEAFRKMTLLK